MKNKLIGIFVCMILVGAVLPVTGETINNIIIKDNDEINPFLKGNTWMRTLGGSEIDRQYDGHQTSDGGYIIVGYTKSYGAGENDVWLIKVDNYGNKEWDKTFGGPGHDYGCAVKQTIEGGYIIAGRGEYSGTSGISCLIKTNELGELQWEETYYYRWAFDICQTDDEGYIVVGGLEENLMKVDKDGNKIWGKSIEDIDYLRSVQLTNDGGFIMIAYRHLIKTNNDGDIEWITKLDPFMFSQCVLQNNDGGYTVVGYQGNRWEPRGWMIRTDENGKILSRKNYIDSKIYYLPNSLYQTPEGGYIMAGGSRLKDHPLFDESLWLAKTDEFGNILWQKGFYGGSNLNFLGLAVQQTIDGGYFVIGSKHYFQNLLDIWLIKTDANGNVARNRATYNMLFLRFLEQFPILRLLFR